MRFEPVSHDPRGRENGATSTAPPIVHNGRHHHEPVTAAPQQGQPRPPRLDFAVVRELRRELSALADAMT